MNEKSNQHSTIRPYNQPMSMGRTRKLAKKWSDKEVQVMVEMIKEREAIWNRSSLSYKNSYIKNKAWVEIADKTNHSVVDAKIQWNTVKSRFNTERNKVLLSRKEQGVPTYSPKYEPYKSLQFLLEDTVQPPRSTSANLAIEIDSCDNCEDFLSSPTPIPAPVSKKHKSKKTSFTQAPSHDHQRSALMNEISGFLKTLQETPTKHKWKKVFSEYIYCELDQYEEHDAQNLKNQLTMVCVNFQQEKNQFKNNSTRLGTVND